jgi:hypothetical protein
VCNSIHNIHCVLVRKITLRMAGLILTDDGRDDAQNMLSCT